MLYGNDRERMREVYCQAWARHRQGKPLQPLHARIVDVARQHPEYHRLLEDPEQSLHRDYPPELGETNPFLHMAMHLAIREQVETDRPPGIRGLYAALLRESGDSHRLEHGFMDCLAEALWQAQRDGGEPDEHRYLACLRKLGGSG
jgi:hypothetical protein